MHLFVRVRPWEIEPDFPGATRNHDPSRCPVPSLYGRVPSLAYPPQG